eukprot:CAMPEP_0202892810 /NCGR_PEP_ID=MMETSP1392-20130828/2503_1 /ASSEMBLY_ACC=CAM_ASM_000868 /TAXON_ID=225041 /ORGANISM="Chlamydomonas chlamydogama, Strain SAG 11-48b" /LENGTH=37 /DNA_ID= /DNA_START= /DNA_END= /DNA_ORIENTATION=
MRELPSAAASGGLPRGRKLLGLSGMPQFVQQGWGCEV